MSKENNISNHPTKRNPILTKSEQKQILVDWNDTSSDYPIDKCIHELFEQKAESAPLHTALISGKNHLTYDELFLEVKKLASILNSHNVSPDTPVALLLERSTKTVIAIYSVFTLMLLFSLQGFVLGIIALFTAIANFHALYVGFIIGATIGLILGVLFWIKRK